MDKSIIQWQDTPHSSFTAAERRILLLLTASGAVVMTILGAWLHDLNFYLASAVFVAIGVCIAVQRQVTKKLPIILSMRELQLGTHIYAINELTGFWLEKNEKQLLIHIEGRRLVLPLTITYRNQDSDEARTNFLEVLPELEPREITLNDRISAWLRL